MQGFTDRHYQRVVHILSQSNCQLNYAGDANESLEVVQTLSSLQARCWPEAFHATFIHNIQRKGEDRIGWRRSRRSTISTTTTFYHHHYPQTLTENETWGGK